jgi:hypothetical protein
MAIIHARLALSWFAVVLTAGAVQAGDQIFEH